MPSKEMQGNKEEPSQKLPQDNSLFSPDEMIQINNILKTNMGQVIKNFPEVKKVFSKYFGDCFNCPSFGMEEVAAGCSIHRVDPVTFGRECLEVIRKAKSGGRTCR